MSLYLLKKYDRNSVRDSVLSYILSVIYFAFAIYFFDLFVMPAMLAKTDLRVGADTLTYIETAKFYGDISNLKFSDVISISSNLFGPVIVLLLTKYNYALIAIMNSVLFMVSLLRFNKFYKFNIFVFMIIMFLNPITLLSLTTLNKEIIGLSSVLFFMSFWKSRRKTDFIISLVLAFLTRWQQAAVILLLIPYLRVMFSNYRRTRYLPVFILLGASIMYPPLSPYLDFTGDTRQSHIQNQMAAAGGLLQLLNRVQDSFGYWLVFPIKALLNYVGNLPRIITLFDMNNGVDLYNRLLTVHQLIMFLLIAFAAMRSKIGNFKLELLIIFLYSVVYCVSLTINYRYFYPIYPLFIMLAIGAYKNNRRGRE